MFSKNWLCLFLLSICTHLFGFDSHSYRALDAQIEEDISGMSRAFFRREELFRRFEELDKANYQVLYCRLRKNQIYWMQTQRSDEKRNRIIFLYFSELLKKYTLPDLDFLLCTEDGFHENSPCPMFVFAADKTAKQNLLLFPDHEALEGTNVEDLLQYSYEYSWEKKRNKGFFRGVGTGRFDLNVPFYGNDRVRILVFSHENPELLEADLTRFFHPEMAHFLYRIQKPSVPSLPIKDHFLYKYLLDVDGNSTTYSRGRWVLCSNSVLLKVMSNFTQWYYNILLPYENYIPIQNDLSNLREVFAWLKANDAAAYKIAMNGQQLGVQAFSRESIDHYIYRLLVAYSKKIRF